MSSIWGAKERLAVAVHVFAFVLILVVTGLHITRLVVTADAVS